MVKRIVSVEYLEKENGLIILLSDELLVFTYKRSLSSLTFFLKQRVKLWDEEYLRKELSVKIDEENQVYSSGLCLFDYTVVCISNRVNLMMTIEVDVRKLNCERVYIQR